MSKFTLAAEEATRKAAAKRAEANALADKEGGLSKDEAARFDGLITEAEALDASGAIPIEVAVSERKHRYFGVGATISSTDGGGVEGYWGHRNLFGRAEKLRIDTGYLAKQAAGSVLIWYGETVVFVGVVTGKPREGIDFFPLTVDYRERCTRRASSPAASTSGRADLRPRKF